MAKHNFTESLYEAWAEGLLKKLSTASKTSMIETLPQEDFFKEGKTLDFIDIAVGGVGPYTKTDGSNTPWSGFKQKQVKTLKYSIELDFDISVEWNVDSVDMQESHNILTAENILKRHNTFHMIPKFDMYSFAKFLYKDGAGTEYDFKIWKDWDDGVNGTTSKPTIVKEASNVASGSTINTAEKLLAQIEKMILAFDNAEIPLENLVLFLAPLHYHMLESLKKGHLRVDNDADKLNYVLSQINEVKLVKVPESRLWSQIDKSDFTPKTGANKIGLLLLYVPAAFKAFSRNIVRVWAANENIRADSNVIQRRLHGVTHLYPAMEQGVYGYLLKETKA